MSVLLVRPASVEAADRALKGIADRFPGAIVTVLVRGEGEAVRSPEGEILETIPRAGKARDLWRGLARMRFEEVVLPFLGAPHAPAPIARFLFFGSLPGSRTWIVEDAGGVRRLGPGRLAWELARAAFFHLLDLSARIRARVLVALLGPAQVRIEDSELRRRPGTSFLLPILPDLSHTFLYREVLALLERNGATDVVCLERGAPQTVHAEARALLGQVRFVERRGILLRYLGILRRVLRAPRRTAALFTLYARQPGGSPADLLGRLPLQEPRHPGNAFELADLLEKRGGGHLHVYGSAYPSNVAMGAAILLGLPFSISAYEDFDFPYRWKMLGEKYDLATFLRATTAASRERLGALLGSRERIPVVPWGIDASRWEGGGVCSDEGVLVSACRLVEKKGLRFVVHALVRLRDVGVPFRWRIAGDGPEEAALRALVRDKGLEDRVDFLGARTSDEVRELLAGADVAVLPCVVAKDGDRDGIPTFLLEAMLCEVPVVTTPVSGIPELVRDGDTGFLAPPGDPEALARALEAVLRGGARSREVARRGREAVLRTLDVRESARRIAALVHGGPDG